MYILIVRLRVWYWRMQLLHAQRFASELDSIVRRERSRAVRDLTHAAQEVHEAEIALITARADRSSSGRRTIHNRNMSSK